MLDTECTRTKEHLLRQFIQLCLKFIFASAEVGKTAEITNELACEWTILSAILNTLSRKYVLGAFHHGIHGWWVELTKHDVHQGQCDASADGSQHANRVGKEIPSRRILKYSLSRCKNELAICSK